jgi:glycosyltransferase involved in cell wall biosynthesis
VRVALVHYWLLGMRGGEKVLEALCRMYPEADIFTLFYDPQGVSETIRRHRVIASFLNPLRSIHRSLLPLMPVALEQFDLRGYDLIISSEAGPAKGVLVSAASRHVCYCHSPMRYLWELYPAYAHEWAGGRVKRALTAPVASYLRLWDYATAARVDTFAANSGNTQRRIRRAFGRESTVVYPPVAVERFLHRPAKGYVLTVGEFVAYKQLDHAVAACTRTGRKLKLVGDGPEFQKLRAVAGPTVEFCGRVSDSELRELYAECRALLVPGEEDFGIATVEALASGKPVIGLRRGGTPEIAYEKSGFGLLYDAASADGMEQALRQFDSWEASFDPVAAQRRAEAFSEVKFREGMTAVIA